MIWSMASESTVKILSLQLEFISNRNTCLISSATVVAIVTLIFSAGLTIIAGRISCENFWNNLLVPLFTAPLLEFVYKRPPLFLLKPLLCPFDLPPLELLLPFILPLITPWLFREFCSTFLLLLPFPCALFAYFWGQLSDLCPVSLQSKQDGGLLHLFAKWPTKSQLWHLSTGWACHATVPWPLLRVASKCKRNNLIVSTLIGLLIPVLSNCFDSSAAFTTAL